MQFSADLGEDERSEPDAVEEQQPPSSTPKLCVFCKDPIYPKTRLCKRHKNAADTVARDARDQKKKGNPVPLERYKELLKDDAAMKTVLDDYIRKNPTGKPGARRVPVEWAQYIETHSVSSAVMDDANVQKLDWVAFQTYFEQKRRWDEATCKEKWQEYLADPTIGRDYKGMDPDEPLRLFIPHGDTSTFRQKTEQTKTLQQGSRQQRSMSSEELAVVREELHRGHSAPADSFHQTSGSLFSTTPLRFNKPLGDAALTYSANSGAQTHPLAVGAPPASPEKSGQRGQPSVQSPGQPQEGSVAEQPEKKRRKASVDVDRLRNNMMSKMTRDLSDCQAAMATALDSAADALANQAVAQDKSHKVYLSTIESRMDLGVLFMGLVKRDTEADEQSECMGTKHFVKNNDYKAAPGAAGEFPVQSLLADAMSKLTTKPVQQEGDLKCFDYMSDFLANVQLMTEEVKLRESEQQWKSMKAAAKQLTESISKRVSDLARNVKQVEAAAKRKQDRAASAEAKAAAKPAVKKEAPSSLNASCVFDLDFQEHFEFPHFEVDLAKAIDVVGVFKKPFVIRDPIIINKLRECKDIEDLLKAFLAQYRLAPSCRKDGRTVAPVDIAIEHVKTCMESVLPKTELRMDVTHIKGLENVGSKVWLFGQVVDNVKIGTEPGMMATVRVIFEGEFLAVAVSSANLARHLVNRKKADPNNVTPDALASALAVLSQEELGSMAEDGHGVYSTSVAGPAVLYLPCGWVLALKSINAINHYGIRMSFCMGSQDTIDNLTAISECTRSPSLSGAVKLVSAFVAARS